VVRRPQGAIPHLTQYLRGHPLRSGPGPCTGHGCSGPHGAGHVVRGGRGADPLQAQGRPQLQAARVP